MKTRCSMSVAVAVGLLLVAAATHAGGDPAGWQVWEQNCATRCHTGIQMPPLPDDPKQVETILRHMRGIANFPGEHARALEKFLLDEEEE